MIVSMRLAVRLAALALTLVTFSIRAGDAPVRPGEETVTKVCSVCHGTGLMNAPKIGDSGAWPARLKAAGSIDALVESAEHGKGNMPPRGGRPDLSDADLKAAIQFMLSKSGG